MSSPSSFTKAIENVERLAQAPPKLSVPSQTKILFDFEAALSGSAAQQNIMDEIDDLALAAIECNRSFNRILLTFTKIITGGATGKLRTDMEALVSRWTAIYKKYHDMLSESSDVAAVSEQRARDFQDEYTTLLSDPNIPMTHRKDMIREWIAIVESEQGRYNNTSQEFSDLSVAVYKAYSEWQRIVQEFKLSDNISVSEMTPYFSSTALKAMDQSFSQMSMAIVKLSAALGVCPPSGGIIGTLGLLSPRFFCSTFADVFGSDPRMSQLKASVGMLSTHDGFSNGNQDSTRYTNPSVLKPSIEEFNIVTSRLGAFAGVWASMLADLRMMEEKLGFVCDTESASLFRVRLRVIARTYETFGDGCARYRAAIKDQL
ncbi:hypothetical protein EIP91_004433 [Steccherinum ochraceum]|uniref:Uncharacterized protein n=1 Tax=Steccherinum ochraceum TaxID=92696 RepID=A0A4R0R8U4_9APHY|nr:hypothetical protein EIP91_004433 [Steccherinum ochraceum]